MRFIAFGDVVEKNGKTIRQNNLERLHHHIPVGTLVEVEIHEEHRETWLRGTARMYVLHHARDAAGEPLYTLSMANPLQLWFERRPTDIWDEIIRDRDARYLADGRRDDSPAANELARRTQDRLTHARGWWCVRENYPAESLRVVLPDDGTFIDGEGI